MHGARTLRLALPQETIALCPDCEEGAMPPFGELYSHRVFADESLVGELEVVFSAGTHTVGRFGRPRHDRGES